MDLVNNSVYLKIPKLEELSFTEALLGCPETMAFNNKWGGTVPFPKEKWKSFHNSYCTEASDKIYFHVYNLDNQFIGEVSTRYDKKYKNYILNIKIKYEYRGNNHAYDSLELFLDYLFLEKGVHSIVDNVAIDNSGAIHLLKKIGFNEFYRDKEIVLLGLKKEEWI